MKILAIHDGHNASAAVLIDGRIVAAVQEERLKNSKNYFGWPEEAIRTLKSAGCKTEDIDFVAMAGNHTARPPTNNSVGFYKTIFSGRFAGKLAGLFIKSPFYKLYKNKIKEIRINQIRNMDINCPVEFIEHHLCHASAVYHSQVKDDGPWLVLTLDGSGDGLCATVNHAERGDIKRLSSTSKGHSIGNIYSRMTFMMGFTPWEHEYKLMGMAPYASENEANKLKSIFQNYLDLDLSDPMRFKRRIPEATWLIVPRLNRDFVQKRFDVLCGGLQLFTEDLIIKWVKACIKKTGLKRLALSGGVFMNVKVNKLIMELDEVEDLCIMPSCGDESNIFGAAYQLFQKHTSSLKKETLPLSNIYLGPDEGNETQIRSFLENQREKGIIDFAQPSDMPVAVAKYLTAGEIVARCSGRMEFGARALGNRSILADPSNPKIVPVINKMIKKRDFWMPFAPVVLEERIHDYLINPKKFLSPFMMLSYDTTENRDELWAGLHPFDMSARAQTVNETDNGEYYRIIKAFEKITGRGVLLNTSFNLHGSPIVLDYTNAWGVFINTGLQIMQIGPFIVHKTISPNPSIGCNTRSSQL